METLANYLKDKELYDLWIPTCQKLAKIFLLGENYDQFKTLLDEIKGSQLFTDINLANTNDLKGIGIYAEIASLEIQYYLEIGDMANLRQVNDSLV